MTAKKLYKDAVFFTAAVALDELGKQRASVFEIFGFDPLAEPDVFKTNIPDTTATDENGEEILIPALGTDDEGNLTFGAPETLGTLALVTLYEGQHQPDPTAAPLAKPLRVYLVQLPSADQIAKDKKLSAYLEALFKKDLLSRARAIAKRDHDQKAPLIADPIAQLIAAASSTSGSANLAAFRVMFPIMQRHIIRMAQAAAERAKAAGKHAQARLLLATYSASRVDRRTLQECFQSAEAAAHHFPQMPQEQWVALLRAAIQTADRCPVPVLVKDEEGNTMKDEAGKAIRKIEYVAVSRGFFLDCIATRDQKALELDEAPGLIFDGMTLDGQPTAPAAPVAPATPAA